MKIIPSFICVSFTLTYFTISHGLIWFLQPLTFPLYSHRRQIHTVPLTSLPNPYFLSSYLSLFTSLHSVTWSVNPHTQHPIKRFLYFYHIGMTEWWLLDTSLCERCCGRPWGGRNFLYGINPRMNNTPQGADVVSWNNLKISINEGYYEAMGDMGVLMDLFTNTKSLSSWGSGMAPEEGVS